MAACVACVNWICIIGTEAWAWRTGKYSTKKNNPMKNLYKTSGKRSSAEMAARSVVPLNVHLVRVPKTSGEEQHRISSFFE